MEEYAKIFYSGKRRKVNPVYKKMQKLYQKKIQELKQKGTDISKCEREILVAEIKKLKRDLRKTQYSDQMDSNYKRMFYIRYADDFLIGVIGSKKEAEQIKSEIGDFLFENLCIFCPKSK